MNGKCKDNNQIADAFNKYFINIGTNLVKLIPNTQNNPNSVYLEGVERNEVENIIKQLKNASSGYHGIHSPVLKQTYLLYLQPLTHVLHLCITQDIFPDEMKKAKVIPFYNNGDAEKTYYLQTCVKPAIIFKTTGKINVYQDNFLYQYLDLGKNTVLA